MTVLAAASLTETFDALGAGFEKRHPGVTVSTTYGGSGALAQQIVQGAPVDVFASAAGAPMMTVTKAGLAARPTVFATNVLELVVPKGNPAHVESLADLSRPGLKVVLCDMTVPCGSAAQTLLQKAGVAVRPVSLEQDVKQVLSKVELDEADAGLVYVTDARSAHGEVATVDVPEATAVVNDYPIAVLEKAPNPAAARAFVAYVRSPVGTKALRDAGFGPAP
ncbi:molybdate ABC transporter substrate-binding protein [Pseudolysinimonas sp.]|uniref:molybdate ABC transporter substrate-binding protein n=1 Tax=Pseudolysinimonas sp. TaxID=2680009 RepID=UPI003F7D191F